MALMTCAECSGPVSSDAKACPKCGAKPPKRTTLFTKIVAGFFALFVVFAIFGNSGSKTEQPAQITAGAPAVAAAAVLERCTSQRAELLDKVRKHMEAGRSDLAHVALWDCARAMPSDQQYAVLLKQTEVAGYLHTITSKSAAWDERLSAHRKLVDLDPTTAAPYANELKRLEARELQEEKNKQKAVAAQKRKEGVSIGMTKEDVLASSWGRPQKVNSTTTARGTSEQWVYGGGYLYFDGNILTSIQN